MGLFNKRKAPVQIQPDKPSVFKLLLSIILVILAIMYIFSNSGMDYSKIKIQSMENMSRYNFKVR